MCGIIQAVQEQEITLPSNVASIPFANVDIRTRSAINCQGWMNHNEGSAIFSILEGGGYEVDFNANVTSATAGVVVFALFADGVQVPGTEMDAVIAAPGDFENISFSKSIRTCCKGTVNLSINSIPSVVYNGGATPVITETQVPIVKNANISVDRIS